MFCRESHQPIDIPFERQEEQSCKLHRLALVTRRIDTDLAGGLEVMTKTRE
jgi:hypothetical protein